MDLAWWLEYVGIPLVTVIFGVDAYIHRCQLAECEKLNARIDAAGRELYEYKINSASLFATVAAMRELKSELVTSLGRIEDKLDRMGERNDRNDRSDRRSGN